MSDEGDALADPGKEALRQSLQDAVDSFEANRRANVAILYHPFNPVSVMEKDFHSSKGLSASRTAIDPAEQDPWEGLQGSIAILEGCHLLYRMRIGGFDRILDALERMREDEGRLFITTWNIHAWNYLDNAIGISAHFPMQIQMPDHSFKEMKERIMAKYEEGEIEFKDDELPRQRRLLEWEVKRIRLLGKDRDLKCPRIEGRALRKELLRKKVYLSPEDKVFEQIHHLSGGNIGVAREIWMRSLHYPTIRPSDVMDACKKFSMSREEAFLAAQVLRKERMGITQLEEEIGDQVPVGGIVAALRQKEIVRADGGTLRIRAENLKFTIEALAKHGMA